MLGRVTAIKVKSGRTKPALMLRETERARGEITRVTLGRSGQAMEDCGAVRTRTPDKR